MPRGPRRVGLLRLGRRPDGRCSLAQGRAAPCARRRVGAWAQPGQGRWRGGGGLPVISHGSCRFNDSLIAIIGGFILHWFSLARLVSRLVSSFTSDLPLFI